MTTNYLSEVQQLISDRNKVHQVYATALGNLQEELLTLGRLLENAYKKIVELEKEREHGNKNS